MVDALMLLAKDWVVRSDAWDTVVMNESDDCMVESFAIGDPNPNNADAIVVQLVSLKYRNRSNWGSYSMVPLSGVPLGESPMVIACSIINCSS